MDFRIDHDKLVKYNGPGGDVIIPDGVKEIGNRVFVCRNDLTSVVIPDGVKVIGEGAFLSCSRLTSVEIPSSVVAIGRDAFMGCSSLHRVTIPDSVSFLGKRAFAYCYNLREVRLPGEVIDHGPDPFDSCPHFSGYFAYCSSAAKMQAACDWLKERDPKEPDQALLIDFILRNGATLIDCLVKDQDATALGNLLQVLGSTKITLNTLNKAIDNVAYHVEMRALLIDHKNKLYPPERIEKIEAQRAARALTKTTISVADWKKVYELQRHADYYEILRYLGQDDDVVIPDVIGSLPVREIAERAFAQCTHLTSVVIPSGVTTIGKLVFEGCEKLTAVIIPASVKKIGVAPFAKCKALKSVEVDPANPLYHSAGNCLIETATKTLVAGCACSVIPQDGSVGKIGSYAFWGNAGLASIVIPDGIEQIGTCAFFECANLLSIELPASVTSIGQWAFRECKNMIYIEIPDSVTSISGDAFWWCFKLTILAPDGSLAQQVAREHGISFEALK